MEYIRFENEKLNEYFKERTKKDNFTLDDLKSLDNIDLGDTTIYSDDLKILAQLNKKVKTNYSVLLIIGSKENYSESSELLEEYISSNVLDNIKGDIWIKYESFDEMSETQLEYWISVNDRNIRLSFASYKGAQAEIVKKLKNKSNIEMNVDFDYDIDTMLDMIKALKEFEKLVPENASEIEKFLIIYRTLSFAIDYDSSGCSEVYLKSHWFTRSISGGILYGRAVCGGYAKCLTEVLNYFNIDSNLQHNENHAWHKVKIDGKWYNVDLTWDYEYLRKNYMPIFALLSDEDFYKIHPKPTREDSEGHEECLESYPKEIIGGILYHQMKIQKGVYKTKGKGIPKLIGKEQYKCNALGRRVEKSRILAMMKTIIAENKRDIEERIPKIENKIMNLLIKNDELFR